MKRNWRAERGDTIIEVMLAITIFSMVVVGALLLMNQSMAIAQRSVEVTQVRAQIDAQAEMIRHAHQQYIADPAANSTSLWGEIKKQAVANVQYAGDRNTVNGSTCPAQRSDIEGFFLLREGAQQGTFDRVTQYQPALTFSRLNGQVAQGLWAQIVKVTGGDAQNAYDVYIQACWDSVGSDMPVTIGTIVRLYDPR